MATSYPGAIDNFTNPDGGGSLAASTPTGEAHHVLHANAYDAIEAIETEVGKTTAPTAGSVRARLAALEAGGTVKNFWGGAVSLSGPAGNFAWKGNQFAPTNTITVYGITVSVNNLLADGVTVKGAITTVSAGNVATISLTQVYTQTVNSGVQGGQFYMPFAAPVTMTGGTTYGIMAGYTAGGGATSTTSFPLTGVNANMFAASYGAPPGTLTVASYYNMSTLAPVVGTAITLTGGPATGVSLAIGLVWS